MEEFYKYNRAYFIRFDDIESDTYLNNYIFPNFAKILDQSAMDTICVEEDEEGYDCMVVFLNESKVIDFMQFCLEENLVLLHGGITEDLLNGTDLDPVVVDMMESDEFELQFSKFFQKNLTIDIILDKINRSGKESLNQYERQFLESEKF